MVQHTDTIERNPLNKPWERQRVWKKRDTPSYHQLIEWATETYIKLQHRAFFYMTYLTGGRITEVLSKKQMIKHTYKKEENKGKVKYIIENTQKLPYYYSGLQKKDISYEELDDVGVMVVFMENRKNTKLDNLTKRIPIPISKEYEMVRTIKNYLSALEPDTILFPFSVPTGERIINKCYGLNAHFLRDIRATHLVWNYEFTEFQLMMYMGWVDGRPAARYVKKDWRKIVKSYK